MKTVRPKVYFIPIKDGGDMKSLQEAFCRILRVSRATEGVKKDELVPVKIHFGEEGNRGYISADIVRVLVDDLKQKGSKPFLTDTNVLYMGQRVNAVDHLTLAYEHGFTYERTGVPVVIADGLRGEAAREVEVKGRRQQSASIASSICTVRYLFCLSHFTGHMLTGFGATLKNLGMGFASRAGKQRQHASFRPTIRVEKCQRCGSCLLNCPVKAISERNEKGFSIEQARCVGCAVCLVHCPYHAIEVSWAGSARELAEKMMEYALAVVSQVRYKYFFNLCIRITKECDCLAKDEAAVVPDIGICASEDPVAIDKASLDLVFKASRKDIFSRLHPEAYSCLKQLEYAQDLGLGSLDYELIQTQ